MRRLFTVLLLALLVSTSHAGTAAKQAADPVLDVLELSGATKMFDQFPSILAAEIQKRRSTGDPCVDVVGPVMLECFASKSLNSDMAAFVRRRINRDQVGSFLDFLRSPLNTKMTKLETTATTPLGQQQMQDYAKTLSAHPPSASRTKLVNRLEKATGSTDMMLTGMLTMFRGFLSGMSMVDPSTSASSGTDIDRVLREMELQLRPMAEQQTMLVFLFVYRDTSDAELEQYIQMHEGPTGQSLTELLANGMLVAFRAASGQAGEKLARLKIPSHNSTASGHTTTGAR